jgi:hypothetical protein
MRHSRAKFKLWLLVSAAYLLLTAWVIIYSSACEEMFCHMAMFYPGLPWTLFLSVIIDFESFSLTGWVISTLLFAALNTAILYVLLSDDKVVTRGDESGEVGGGFQP